jgi:hypothetical protein
MVVLPSKSGECLNLNASSKEHTEGIYYNSRGNSGEENSDGSVSGGGDERNGR